MEPKFYICETCGKIIMIVKDSAAPTMCCGKAMKELVPGSVDAALEKHVPVIEENAGKAVISVGSVEHPMLDAHYIEWIMLVTENGSYTKYLKPGMVPKAEFLLADGEKAIAAYAYCNLHGLWKN